MVGEGSWTEIVFQQGSQQSLKIRPLSCFKSIKFTIPSKTLSIAFLQVNIYVLYLRYCICSIWMLWILMFKSTFISPVINSFLRRKYHCYINIANNKFYWKILRIKVLTLTGNDWYIINILISGLCDS